MNPKDLKALLRQKNWTVVALADRWGFSRRYVTTLVNNERRGVHWNDAINGLPQGPGLYRKGLPKEIAHNFDLQIGSLVASEGEFYTFGYGSRGVVVEILGKDRFQVVWDGGTEMEIDADCLEEWVMELGLTSPYAEIMRRMPLQDRLEFAKKLDLYS